MQKEFQRLIECGKYEAFKSNPLVLTDFEASPFYEGVREPNRSGLAPNLIKTLITRTRLGAVTTLFETFTNLFPILNESSLLSTQFRCT